MNKDREIWIFIEQEDGEIAAVSLELLSKGRELAERLDSRVCALLFGHGIAHLSEKVIAYGADIVLLADHPELASYRTLPYAKVAIDLVRDRQPYILLLGATPNGRDLAPRIASAVRAGLTADCTDLQIGDYRKKDRVYGDLLYQIRPAFGGNVIATIVNPEMHPQLATVREGVMRMAEPDRTRKGQIERIEPQFSAREPGVTGGEAGDAAAVLRSEERVHCSLRRRGRGQQGKLRASLRTCGDAGRSSWGNAGRSRCRFRFPRTSGGADRDYGPTPALHRLRHIGHGPTPRRDGSVQQDHRHQL